MIRHRSGPALWWLVFLPSFLLYLLTSQRHVSWQDSGMFQWRILAADFSGQLGLALAHPLYILAGQLMKLLPGEDLAWKINAFSGLGTAVALATFACLAWVLTRRMWIAVTIASMLALVHGIWWLSTIAEVYTWVLAGLTAELWLLVKLLRAPHWKTAGLLALVNGLGWSLHNFALLPLPVYAATIVYLVVKGELTSSALLRSAVAFSVGSALYTGMTVALAFETGEIGTAVNSALFGAYRSAVLNSDPGAGSWKVNGALAGLSFLNMLLPLAVAGLYTCRAFLEKRIIVVLVAISVLEFVFVVRYPVPDQFTFILPTLLMTAVAAALGLRALVDAGPRWRTIAVIGCSTSLVAMPLAYGILPELLNTAGIAVQRARALPFRNESGYWIIPWKHNEQSAYRFAEAALQEASPNGVILADETSVYPLLNVRARGARPNSDIIIQYNGGPLPPYNQDSSRFFRAVGDRPLFVVSPVPGYIPAGMDGLLKDVRFARLTNNVLFARQ